MSSTNNQSIATKNESSRKRGAAQEMDENMENMPPASKTTRASSRTTAKTPTTSSSASTNEPSRKRKVEKTEEDKENQAKKLARKCAVHQANPDAPSTSSCACDDSVPTTSKSTPAPRTHNARGLLRASPEVFNKVVKMIAARYFPRYHRTIPEGCEDTIEGDKDGRMEMKIKLKGTANKKFNEEDEKNWNKPTCSVQAVIIDDLKDGHDKYVVLFEGWSCKCHRYQTRRQLKNEVGDALRFADIRYKFCIALLERQREEWKNMSAEVRAKLKQANHIFRFPDMERMLQDPDNAYWRLEDLTFLHSKRLTQAGQAAVLYVKTKTTYNDPNEKLPNFHMVTNVLLTDEMADVLKISKYGRHIKDLLKEKEVASEQGSCPSKDCKCHQRHQILFDGVRRYLFTKDGRLILDDKEFQKNERRIVIECSDACGCAKMKCPNRQVQRGGKKLLAVVKEEFKGFGVRTVYAIEKGEYICEYMGLLTLQTECDENVSYQAGMESFEGGFVIDAANYGNVGRFPSHSCNPNAAFFEVYTRDKEKDELVPRIAIFALRDIAEAEEVTINYYPGYNGVQKRGIKCRCNSDECMKYMPEH